ncbi:heavy-metal-associated domain-containing protein [Kingella kingae]|uniref:heavy-metal-associated domain-containing protein n=1 Tax=Kingella kingae TaxID=504 RepID=UPI00254A52FF|nr:cation transporter [Kingella kingae]MDK4574663.1 cation transporter [Kingella kingae]MDK4606814.1 cation transporter [Kingella kingae]
MATVTLNIDGMTCGGCVKSVAKVLGDVNGVTRADVDLKSATAVVEFDDAKTNIAALIDVVEDAGFDAVQA